MIAIYFIIFGVANIATPFMSNYLIYSVITVFKMMCAGGTDCGANVWILEMWPGKDAWLQALHFSFAVGCALGPLIVEPFLSVEYDKKDTMNMLKDQLSGNAVLHEQGGESRIYIPYGGSGLISIGAALIILYLYFLDQRRARAEAVARDNKAAAASGTHKGELIPLSPVRRQSQVDIEAGSVGARPSSPSGSSAMLAEQQQPLMQHKPSAAAAAAQQPSRPSSSISMHAQQIPEAQQEEEEAAERELEEAAKEKAAAAEQRQSEAFHTSNKHLATTTVPSELSPSTSNAIAINNQNVSINTQAPQRRQSTPQQQQANLAPQHRLSLQQQQPLIQQQQPPVKITSKAKEQLEGRPPYYVIFAIGLAAMCLSFYCGIEITSMNYLATFAVNIDLQLPKSTAALMSSALTISFAVGRGFGIWIANSMKPHKLFYLCIAVMATGNVFMLIFANTAETLLWCSICLFGIGCGPMFPAIVSFYDDRISKVTNTVSGIFILGSMFNVAANSLIIGHHIIDNALILIKCNLYGSFVLLLLFGTLHLLTRVKKSQRVRKFKIKQQNSATLVNVAVVSGDAAPAAASIAQADTSSTLAAAAAALSSPSSSASSPVTAPASHSDEHKSPEVDDKQEHGSLSASAAPPQTNEVV